MMRLPLKKQICMVGGCMPNKYWVKLYVKAHYMWYYIKHPKAWWQMKKIKNRNLRQLMNLYIGRLNMIDNEHDEINFKNTILNIYNPFTSIQNKLNSNLL